MERYVLDFDFDAEGDAPKQLIRDRSLEWEAVVIEVTEDPTMKPGRGAWSWDGDDWQPSPLALHILALLNANPLPAEG